MVKAIGLCMIFGLCLSAYLVTRRHRDQLILIPFGLFAVAVSVTTDTSADPNFILLIINRFLWIGFSAYLSLMIFRQIFYAASVNPQEIYGAISVYLLIGFIFAQIYEMLFIFDPLAISFNPMNFEGGVLQSGDLLYFSFVTLATVGYGDITPAIPFARATCVVESVFGIMYVAVFIARFVSIHSNRNQDTP